MSKRPAPPPTYIERLRRELDEIRTAYVDVLASSRIYKYEQPSTRGMVHFTNTPYRWAGSDSAQEAARMALLQLFEGWEPRFRLLFPHPTGAVSQCLDMHLGRMRHWLIRESNKGVAQSIQKAVEMIEAGVTDLHALTDLLPADQYAIRLTVDTNTLIDNPDLAAHVPTLGPRYMAHLLPTVLREIDDHKRGGRTPELREAAKRADRRLKGLRTNGDVRAGVRVAGEVYAVFEHVEPKAEHLPSWLDLSVPDDRIVASSLLLQSDHPGSALYVATGDINLQTKLSAVGLPFVELP
ncbi:hypothetical protein Franean1_6281 [Parafrankia sp. EAN1pec]|uniref:PIN domain-containing protein n=1 Tax=Parafrankia sp. (strain EAN1pec) TaxID=298653 RepID=UPI0000544AED|nr:hypothetical protein Franean1_6281 [Frankia sp. EAN1pec]